MRQFGLELFLDKSGHQRFYTTVLLGQECFNQHDFSDGLYSGNFVTDSFGLDRAMAALIASVYHLFQNFTKVMLEHCWWANQF
jgi:hypothetical protein